MRLWWKRLMRLGALYGLFMNGFLVLRLILGERSTVIAFLNTFAEWLLLPALVLAPAAGAARRVRTLLLLAAPLATLLLFYGARYLERRRSAEARVSTLTVLTHNILADPHPLSDLIDTLRASQADVIALQEVSRDYALALDAALGDLYPYIASHTCHSRFAGQAVYSRYPIVEDDYWQYEWLLTPLGHQRVVVRAPFGEVVVYNVHPTHPGMNGRFFDPSFRSREIHDILARVQAETHPLVLLGDFNMPDHSDDYRAIRQHCVDSYAEVGRGMGWTFRASLPLPFLRLDYVFHSRAWVALRAEVLPQHGGSDHYPVRATLALRRAESA